MSFILPVSYTFYQNKKNQTPTSSSPPVGTFSSSLFPLDLSLSTIIHKIFRYYRGSYSPFKVDCNVNRHIRYRLDTYFKVHQKSCVKITSKIICEISHKIQYEKYSMREIQLTVNSVFQKYRKKYIIDCKFFDYHTYT